MKWIKNILNQFSENKVTTLVVVQIIVQQIFIT